MTTDKLTRLLARIEADTKSQGDTRTPMTGCAITHDQWQAYMTWRSVIMPLLDVVKAARDIRASDDYTFWRNLNQVLAKLAEVDCP